MADAATSGSPASATAVADPPVAAPESASAPSPAATPSPSNPAAAPSPKPAAGLVTDDDLDALFDEDETRGAEEESESTEGGATIPIPTLKPAVPVPVPTAPVNAIPAPKIAIPKLGPKPGAPGATTGNGAKKGGGRSEAKAPPKPKEPWKPPKWLVAAYHKCDRALHWMNTPFRMLPGLLRNLAGVALIATLPLVGITAWMGPTLFPRYDAAVFAAQLEEQIARAKAPKPKPAEEGETEEAGSNGAKSADAGHGAKKDESKAAGHTKPAEKKSGGGH